MVYEDQAGSEDKDSCSTEPDQPSAASSLQMIMGDSSGGRRPKRRRRIFDAAGPSTVSANADRYPAATSAAADYYEPQILGGVGVDPAEPPVADYYDGFGRYVANELRQMDRQSVIIAKRLVNEVLFLGQMGMLNVSTRIETPPQPSRRKIKSDTPVHMHDGHDLLASTAVEFMETS